MAVLSILNAAGEELLRFESLQEEDEAGTLADFLQQHEETLGGCGRATATFLELFATESGEVLEKGANLAEQIETVRASLEEDVDAGDELLLTVVSRIPSLDIDTDEGEVSLAAEPVGGRCPQAVKLHEIFYSARHRHSIDVSCGAHKHLTWIAFFELYDVALCTGQVGLNWGWSFRDVDCWLRHFLSTSGPEEIPPDSKSPRNRTDDERWQLLVGIIAHIVMRPRGRVSLHHLAHLYVTIRGEFPAVVEASRRNHNLDFVFDGQFIDALMRVRTMNVVHSSTINDGVCAFVEDRIVETFPEMKKKLELLPKLEPQGGSTSTA